MLAIYFTLKEALRLWRQNLWIITIIALATGVPDIFLTEIRLIHKHSHSHAFPWLSTIELLTSLFLSAGSTAAILGLLARSSANEPVWPAIWNMVQNKIWVLYRLYCLIVLVTALATVIPFVLASHFVSLKILPLILASVFLVLIKYALAYPVVVVENVRAAVAMDRSWRMTRGNFKFVAGCYAIIGLGTWLIKWFTSQIDGHGMSTDRSDLLATFVGQLIDPIWILSAWCMYWRIKNLEMPAEDRTFEPYIGPQN